MRAHLTVLLVAFAPACLRTDSKNLTTTGMVPAFKVIAPGDGSTLVTADLAQGGLLLPNIELGNGDAIFVSVGTQKTKLTEDVITVRYSATLAGADQSGTAYTIDLERTAGNASAPTSTCTLPTAMTITPPTASSYSRATQDVTITYSPSSTDAIRYSFKGDCVQSVNDLTLATADSGSFVIPHTSILSLNSSSPTSCAVTVTLKRVKNGTIDSHFGSGGTFECHQERTVVFNSAP